MINSISMLDLSKISTLQNVLLKTKPETQMTENNRLLPELNGNDRELKKMANLLRVAEKQAKLPDVEDIIEKFKNGELDPRKLKKGDEITLNLQGKDYKFKIEKDGEFTCKVQGRDDTVRIYQGKNKWGQDCICLEHHYKKEEANFYVTHSIRRPVEEYDKRIKKIIK